MSTTCYGLDGGEALQIAARILWGISFAALNLGSLAYAVADRANAGKRVGASRGLIGVIQASCFIGGGLLVLRSARATCSWCWAPSPCWPWSRR